LISALSLIILIFLPIDISLLGQFLIEVPFSTEFSYIDIFKSYIDVQEGVMVNPNAGGPDDTEFFYVDSSLLIDNISKNELAELDIYRLLVFYICQILPSSLVSSLSESVITDIPTQIQILERREGKTFSDLLLNDETYFSSLNLLNDRMEETHNSVGISTKDKKNLERLMVYIGQLTD
jgi:hypothetical protein